MNIFKAAAVRSLEEATRAIPVIDFAPAFAGSADGLEAVASQVRDACERVGFFYLAGHGVSHELIDRTFAEAGRFFALPREKKAEVAVEKSNCDRGWFDIGMFRSNWAMAAAGVSN